MVTTFGGGIKYEIRILEILAGGSDSQIEARHIQLGMGCRHYTDVIQGWQATVVL